MKKYVVLALALSLAIPVVAYSKADIGKKEVKELVGEYEKSVRKLKTNSEFINKSVLLVVKSEKKATTVGGLLAATELALSEAQHSTIVEPLILAVSQQMGYAKVTVNGAFVKAVELSRGAPAPNNGLAALVMDYDGDSTLAMQVLANIKLQ